MQEVRYMISDTARKVDVEAHVLRYWEEELEIPIARNEMGHRYYTPEDITLFKNIRELKEQGFQLRAIKLLLPKIKETGGKELEKLFVLKEELNYQVSAMGQEALAKEQEEEALKDAPKQEEQMDKRGQLQSVNASVSVSEERHLHNQKLLQFQNILRSAITDALVENNYIVEERVGDKVIKHVDYMLRMSEEKEDERFKKLDEAIRMKQQSRKEIAVAEEQNKKRRFGIRKKKLKNKNGKKEEDV